MPLKCESYLFAAEPMVVDGRAFDVAVYDRNDGRRHAYFSPQGTPAESGDGDDVTRVGYRIYGTEAMFLGMIVDKRLRGQGLGEHVARHFFDGRVEPDAVPCETAHIHKPVIALTLARCGLEPASRACEVEILPRSSYEDCHAPRVNVLHSELDPADMVNGSGGGRFYDVIDPAEVLRRYPINVPEMTVALHTRYLP